MNEALFTWNIYILVFSTGINIGSLYAHVSQ